MDFATFSAPILEYFILDNASLIAIGAGCLGGAVKGFYTLWTDYLEAKQTFAIKFFLKLFVALIMGGAIGYLFNFDYRVAGLTGFAGMDILSNIAQASISSTKFAVDKK